MAAKVLAFSRRGFLAASGALGAPWQNPVLAAARAIGTKPGGLPDLTIREVAFTTSILAGSAALAAGRNWWASVTKQRHRKATTRLGEGARKVKFPK